MGPLGSGLEWTGCSSWLGRTSLHRHWLTVCLVLLSCVVRVGWTTSLEEKRFYAERHKNAVLMAGFHGYQKKVKNVQWKRGNNSVLFYDSGTKMFGQYANRARYDFDNNTLILENVTGEDVGLYEVSLVTENATLVKMVLYLEVIAALSEPRISISFGNSSWAGLNMTCEVSGGKDLSYWWLKDGQPLPQDGRHSVREGNWSLQISNLTHRDCTNYSCVVANRLRSREAHALVTAANISLCEPMRDVQSQPLRNRDLLSLCAGLLCVVGMCLVIYCVRRHGQVVS
ncbi:hepatic and glial cell adhesion molecule [Amia ocellicauda]|uniref:hepatic and glial cell adhesion molecule n=1 Tax=Amia ocellicauda TaxID=2972642 RepID=UPI003463E77D